MTLEEYLGVGLRLELGSHTFSAGEIRRFAGKYDPQPFHLDEDAAAKSVFGGLCASGWHTASMWMKLNIVRRYEENEDNWDGPGPLPAFGPSPGICDLKWFKPVYAGDTITYYRTGAALRRHPRRPGWRILTVLAEGFGGGVRVVEFISGVLVNAPGR